MKNKMRLSVAVAALAFAGPALAWDVPENPDRYISLGLHTSIGNLSGTHSSTVDPGPDEIHQMESVGQGIYSAGFDIRVPLFKQMTVTLAYDQIAINQTGIRSGNTFQTADGLRGDVIEIGARFYFAK